MTPGGMNSVTGVLRMVAGSSGGADGRRGRGVVLYPMDGVEYMELKGQSVSSAWVGGLQWTPNNDNTYLTQFFNSNYFK